VAASPEDLGMLPERPVVFALLSALALGGCASPPPRPRPVVDCSRIWCVEASPESEPLGLALVRGKRVDDLRGSPAALVEAFNVAYAAMEAPGGAAGAGEPGPPALRLLSVRGGKARVEVLNAEHLTQGMGTTGAFGYLAAATFTLTEIRGVEKVEFVFEEGDHASPGVYTRKRFGEFAIAPPGR
jgi:hypothetical protein